MSRRVFIGHTSELIDYVAAAKRAIERTGDVPVEMASFPAADLPPAQLCREKVRSSDIYLLIAGFRYGSPVRDQPELSYTELEFQAATDAGKTRLVFLLGRDTVGPASLFLDPEHGTRQLGFRSHLGDSGLTRATVSSPADLETAVLHALTELPRTRRIWGIPANPVRFTGREDLLADLRTALHANHSAVVQAVHGMGGVGKTTVALEYAHRHGDEYDIAWWIPAEEPALIPGRLADLARALDLATATDSADVAIARLNGELRRGDRWLLIFDNAEAPAVLKPFLPGGPGHVIITSRNPDWHGIATALGVREFTRSESVQALHSRAPHLTATDADRIADALGDLPLVVDQAAALLAETGMAAQTYLDLLATRTGELVPPSWAVAFDRLDTDDPAGLQLLNIAAWLAPEPVPLTMFTEHPDWLPAPLAEVAADPIALARTTATLRQRAMAQLTPESLHLHRVPAALLRARDNSGWHLAVNLVRETMPADPADPTRWPAWRRQLPHVLAVLNHPGHGFGPGLITLLGGAALYLTARGEHERALPLLERLYDECRIWPGAEDPRTLQVADSLAGVLIVLGEHDRARELNEYLIDHRRATLGDLDPLTLRSASYRAWQLIDLGMPEQARDLSESVLDAYREVLGDDHPDTLVSMTMLALNLSKLGEHERAVELFADTLARSRRVLGDDHPSTLGAANYLFAGLFDLGEHERARELAEDTLARRRRVLGDDHPDTLASATNLALILAELGEEERAREVTVEFGFGADG